MRSIFVCALVLCSSFVSTAQHPAENTRKYWVFFKDKGSLVTDRDAWRQASENITERAKRRRAKQRPSQPGDQPSDWFLIEEGDLPLFQPYIDSIVHRGGILHRQSRWLNAASFYLTPQQKRIVENFTFVNNLQPVRTFYRRDGYSASHTFRARTEADTIAYGQSFAQNEMINAIRAHQLGITGEGVIVGMLDTGFRWRIHEALQSARVIAERDFIQNDDTTANQAGDHPQQDLHGTLTMSVVGGYMPGRLIGPAFGAQFLLAKTEDIRSETRIEEDNWMAGIEWMEALGVDIVSSSLGYNIFDDGTGYRWENGDFDGRTAVTSRAAIRAARLGVIVCTAMGNEGNGDGIRGTMLAPADADSIVSVGAVTFSRTLAAFSSTGPTNDGRIKPELVAPGVTVYGALPGQSTYGFSSGTSLSTPLTAASAALVLSARPELTAMQVRDALRYSSDTIATGDPRVTDLPSNFVGWGLVNARDALMYPTLELIGSSNTIAIFVGAPNGIYSDSVRFFYRIDTSALTSAIVMTRVAGPPLRSNGTYRIDLGGIDPGSIVRFFVEAIDSSGNRIYIPRDTTRTFSFVFGTKTLFPPGGRIAPPTLAYPPRGFVTIDTSVLLVWHSVPEAQSYRLQVSAESSFTTTILDDSSLVGTTREITGLLYNRRYFWRVRARNVNGMGSWSTVWSFSVSLPVSFALRQNYPNPFNNSTTIRFDSPVPVAGAITIFNIFGQKIKTLYSGSFRAGPNTFSWDGTNDAGLRVSTGVYFYALRTSVFSDVKKMMFLR